MNPKSCSSEQEARQLLGELRASGISFFLRDPHGASPSILARPAKRLDQPTRDRVRERRDWLIEVLRQERQRAVLEAMEWLQSVAGRIVRIVPHAADKTACYLEDEARPVFTESELLRLRRDARNGLSDDAVAQVVYVMCRFQGDLLREGEETLQIE